MKRRTFLTVAGAALAGGALWRERGGLSSALAADSGPIKIGLLAPLTGVAAAGGRDMVEGWNLWWKQAGSAVAGRTIEVIVEDDASTPDTALQKARRLVEQREVHMLVGNLLANTGLAVAEYVRGTGTPYFMPIVAADNLTQRDRIPNVLRVAGFSASQMTRPLADYAVKKGYRKVVTIAQDYAFGHEQSGGFVQTFSEGGGKVAGQLWNPLNTSDFSPFLGEIQNLNPDVVVAIQTGADAARLLLQWYNFALKEKIPLLTSQNTVDQSVIRTMKDEPLGLVSSAHYAEGREDAANKRFVDAYQAAYSKLPAIFAAELFTCGMWVAEGIKKVNGRVEDRAAFLKAMREVEIVSSPLGKTRLDTYGNPIYDIYIRQVTKRSDGKLWNTVIETYPAVSQFWKYKPEEFLKQPGYSRQFQGIKS
jgi:branched-chain amino acid transport system substrate-binding protein